jgi:serine O-acetyltransferase
MNLERNETRMRERQVISAQHPDWSREAKRTCAWDPPRALLDSIRSYQRLVNASGGRAFILRKLAVVRHRFWSIVTGADIPVTSRIGGGLLLPHPNGIVIHPHAEIGPNCLIFQQVTIGASTKGVPRIGGHVDIGAGAKIIGPVRVGDHVRIGANAVVVMDVPDGATVMAPVGTVVLNPASEMGIGLHKAHMADPN